MKTIINESSGDVGTAVFYRWHQFIPKNTVILGPDRETLLNSCKADKVQYKGSRSKASSGDFSEYNFLFDLEKEKFNDQFLINLLNNKSKELVGKKLDDLEKVEKILFPTCIDEEGDYTEEFFGSTLISNQTFITLEADGAGVNNKPGIWKIELYEEGITSNNSNGGFIEEELLDTNITTYEKTASPIITITLGPGPEVKNNSTDMYFSYDPQLTEKEKNERLSLSEYKKLTEEITMYKVVWLLLALDNSVTSINLSYKSWIDSINPNRNMKDYIIRNDEYYSTRNQVNIIEKAKDYNYWHDKNSETLVGNKEITTHPILDRKLRKVRRNSSIYSPFVEYNLGDRITYDGRTWESLCSNNKGNSPTISNYWTLSSNINNIFTSRVVIIINPDIGGYSNPGGSITVNTNSLVDFRIFENPGYSINEENPCSYEIDSPEENYILTVSRDPNLGNQITLSVSNWVNAIRTGKLYINFIPVYSTISLSMSDGTGTVSYDQWETQYSDDTLKLYKFIVNGVENNPNFNENNELTAYNGDEIGFIFKEFKKYSLKDITLTYLSSTGETKTRTITPEVLEDNSVKVTDIVDYSSSTYTLNVVPKVLTVYVSESNGFEVSNVIGRVTYGENYNLYFYSDSIFSKVTVKSKNETIEFTNTELDKAKPIDTNTQVTISKAENNEDYCIEINNIQYNLEIILER